MDFPRAWQIANASQDSEHDPRCSFIVGERGLLCDCHVITKHPEYQQNTTLDGAAFVPQPPPPPRPLAQFCEDCSCCTDLGCRNGPGGPVGQRCPSNDLGESVCPCTGD